MLRHFRRDGERAIARMAVAQPAAYCKILTLLVPREHKVEHSNAVSGLSDEELEAAIEHIKASLAARAGDQAKLIEGEAVETTALPAPVEAFKARRPNKVMEAMDTAVGPKERRPRKRKVPSPPGA